ncbi:hypothetical protein GH733_011936 [Mirounga leonina]|nr:hypothetical protein GH733_011936 [Mirounga leonina]
MLNKNCLKTKAIFQIIFLSTKKNAIQNKYKIWKDTNLPYNPKTFKTFYSTVLNLKGLMQVCADSCPRNAFTPPTKGLLLANSAFKWVMECSPKRMNWHFLNYELGKISFYSMSNRSYNYIFTGTFTETLWPYFYVGPTSNSLTTCKITDE